MIVQPPETLRILVDEPIVNKHFANIADLEKDNLQPIDRPRRGAQANPDRNMLPLVAKGGLSELIGRKSNHTLSHGGLCILRSLGLRPWLRRPNAVFTAYPLLVFSARPHLFSAPPRMGSLFLLR